MTVEQQKSIRPRPKWKRYRIFIKFYGSIFPKVMHATDLQESTQTHGKDYFDAAIIKCIRHTAYVENGCEEQ